MGYYLPTILQHPRISDSLAQHPKIFVETGTYLGGSPQRFLDTYDDLIYEKLHTIEISDHNCKIAASRYKKYEEGERDYHEKRIDIEELQEENKFFDGRLSLWHGDSVSILPKILETINEPAVFWLDAHAGRNAFGRGEEDVPLDTEINLILQHDTRHIIAIDDAHLFGKETPGADYRHISIDAITLMCLQYNKTVHEIAPFHMSMLIIQ